MEISLVLLFLGACCIRSAREPAGGYPGERVGPGFWKRIRSLLNPHMEPAGPDNPVNSKKEDAASRLQIRQELDKNSQQMLTRISYREKGRTVSVKYQGNMTLKIAGLVLQLDPTCVKAQEVQKMEGGKFVPSEERVTKVQDAPENEKVRPIKVVPRPETHEKEEMGQRDGGVDEERWGSF